MACFIILQMANNKVIFSKVKRNLKDVFFINLTTACAWFTFIFSLRFIEPAIATSIITSLGPVSTLIVGYVMLKNFTARKIDIFCACGILITILFLGYLTLTNHSGVKTQSFALALAGLSCAAISGFTSAANTVVTKRLIIGGFNSSEIMAFRFCLLIVGSIFWIATNRIAVSMPSHLFIQISLISFLGIALPLFLLQKGIGKIDVNTVALIISIGPIITYLTQSIYGGFNISVYSLVGILIAFSFVVIGVASKI
jgi:drug/metabolite transporter (DMT)-like permease